MLAMPVAILTENFRVYHLRQQVQREKTVQEDLQVAHEVSRTWSIVFPNTIALARPSRRLHNKRIEFCPG